MEVPMALIGGVPALSHFRPIKLQDRHDLNRFDCKLTDVP